MGTLRTEEEIREMLSLYEKKLDSAFLMREEHKIVIYVLQWALGEAE